MTTDFLEKRKLVFWLGPSPTESYNLEFRNRNLTIQVVDSIPKPAILSNARGVVVIYNEEKRNAFRSLILVLSKCAKTYGLAVMAIVPKDENYLSMYAELRRINWFPDNRISPTEYEVAEYIARHHVGPPVNLDLEIQALDSIELSEVEILLLKRAFYDCRKITLQFIPGGRSAKVFQIEAVFNQSAYVPRPLPFFAKIGETERIKTEFKKYWQYVYHHIPFHLHPGIYHERSIFGDQRGIIVGNFVEKSESLREVIRNGRTGIIGAIYLDSLKSWREQSKSHENLNWDIFRPVDVPVERVSAARKLGSKKSPEELLSILNGLPNRKHQNGIVHGDLHDLNIRVRQNDAILIDFAKVREGPIVADCAALEVSLVFDHDLVGEEKIKWIKFVKYIYALKFCKVVPDFKIEKALCWLGAAVYEIRKIACSRRASEYEFSIVLALYLLNRSMYPGESEVDEECKTYAYVIAELLILEIAAEMGCKC